MFTGNRYFFLFGLSAGTTFTKRTQNITFWTVASSMFSYVFQSLISSMHGDEDVIPPSDDEVIPPYLHRMPRSYRQWMPRSYPIPPSDAKVIPPSDAEEVESDGVDKSPQENQVHVGSNRTRAIVNKRTRYMRDPIGL